MQNTPTAADHKAAELVQAEVARTITKWGNSATAAASPGRNKGQLLHAGMAMGTAVIQETAPKGTFPAHTPLTWPKDWDKAYFRDFGSNIANLVVMGAYIQNEIARRLQNGEPTTRTDRTVEPTKA